jgi:hypothetical protein
VRLPRRPSSERLLAKEVGSESGVSFNTNGNERLRGEIFKRPGLEHVGRNALINKDMAGRL